MVLMYHKTTKMQQIFFDCVKIFRATIVPTISCMAIRQLMAVPLGTLLAMLIMYVSSFFSTTYIARGGARAEVA